MLCRLTESIFFVVAIIYDYKHEVMFAKAESEDALDNLRAQRCWRLVAYINLTLFGLLFLVSVL